MGSRKAVLVGVGQYRRNPKFDGPFEPMEPAAMTAEAIRRAIANTLELGDERAESLLAEVDLFAVVEPIAWGYNDLCGTSAEFAGITANFEGLTVPPGGNSPGDLLNTVANRIVAGEAETAILTGSETLFGRRRAQKSGIALEWTPFDGPRDFLKGQRPLTTPLESRHGLTAPIHCYPLFENALRHAASRTVQEHQDFLSRFMAPNTRLAANNPFGWFPTEYTPSEVSEPSEDNRMVCFPYPKRMNAVMEVDLAAAVVIMSNEEADRRGIPEANRVTFLGGGSSTDAWTPCERVDFVSSPGIAAAANAAFEHAGVSVDDVDLFEIYSCFPSAVQLALEAIGVAADDPRGFSLIGGLAYAGGPGNSYSVHGLVGMTEAIREGKGKVGLVSSLGMTATKHAYNVLSNDPARIAAADGRSSKVELDAAEKTGPALRDFPSGTATVETYTVEYGRDGSATRTMFVLRLEDGARTVANGMCTDEEVKTITTNDIIGWSGTVSAGNEATPNRFALDVA